MAFPKYILLHKPLRLAADWIIATTVEKGDRLPGLYKASTYGAHEGAYLPVLKDVMTSSRYDNFDKYGMVVDNSRSFKKFLADGIITDVSESIAVVRLNAILQIEPN